MSFMNSEGSGLWAQGRAPAAATPAQGETGYVPWKLGASCWVEHSRAYWGGTVWRTGQAAVNDSGCD